MEFKVKGKNYQLNFGVRFVAELDETEKYRAEGIEFGMGTMLAFEKLKLGQYGALVTILKHALHGKGFTLDEIYEAIDEYAEENDLETLLEKVETELKNSNAVRTMLARMNAMETEANRKKGLQAKKHTK